MSLNNLPVEWSVQKFEKVVYKIVGGGTPSKSNPEYYQGNIPWMSVKDMNKNILEDTVDHITQDAIDNSATNLIPKGTPIIATRMSLGKVVVAKFDSAINQDLKAIFFGKYIDNNFFVYWYRSLAKLIESLGTGTTVKGIRLEVINNFDFPVVPLVEQQEIVRQLDVMLAQVEQIKARLDAIPAILKKFRQSVLADAVSGKLTEEWRNNQIDIVSWTLGELREFIEKPIYGTSAKSSKEGAVPVLRMGNLQHGEIDWSDLVYTSDATEIKKYDLKLNDLLFNRTNSPELVGKTSIYRGDKDAIFAGYLIRVRCLSNLDPEFLNYHLNSHIGREYCYRVKTDGVSQSNINAQKLIAYPLNCPSIEEQKLIVKLVKEYLGLVNRIEATVQSAQKRVNLLTQSILAKAFSGELTAEWRTQHQDLITGVNSAEALLAKIQSEREASKPVKNTRKKKEV